MEAKTLKQQPKKCRKCDFKDARVKFQLEARGKIYIFTDVPGKKCTRCNEVEIPESSMEWILKCVREYHKKKRGAFAVQYIKYS